MTPIVAFVGRSGAGKTTLVEQVIAELTRDGWKVASIKHTSHTFEADQPGKDSWRHRRAGAVVSVLAGPEQVLAAAEPGHDLTLAELRERFVRGADIIIAEGHKTQDQPKIEVFRAELQQGSTCRNDPYLIATFGDRPECVKPRLPHFAWGDVQGICAFLIANFLPPRADDPL